MVQEVVPRSPTGMPRDTAESEGSDSKDAIQARVAARRLQENPDDLDALEAFGVWLLSQGHTDQALECFHRITQRDPAYPGIWHLKAKAFEALGDRANARLCRKKAAEIKE